MLEPVSCYGLNALLKWGLLLKPHRGHGDPTSFYQLSVALWALVGGLFVPSLSRMNLSPHTLTPWVQHL